MQLRCHFINFNKKCFYKKLYVLYQFPHCQIQKVVCLHTKCRMLKHVANLNSKKAYVREKQLLISLLL